MSTTTTVTFQGNPLTLCGVMPTEGNTAPAFTVLDASLAPVTQEVLTGKTSLVLTVPSLDTSVCDTEIRRFNEEVTACDPSVQVLCISMDLPFAQARWCGAQGIERVTTLSDHRDASFGGAWGVLIQELRLLARAIFVIDSDGTVRYAHCVSEITEEPDYAAAIHAVQATVTS